MSIGTTSVDSIHSQGQSGALAQLYSKIGWRILPFLMWATSSRFSTASTSATPSSR